MRREQSAAEIEAHALEQVAAGGPDALPLNAVARSMSMSPAIHRCFTSREALLADLVVDHHASLADALEAADAGRARDTGTVDRFVAVAGAYRRWALDNPHGYRLIFQTVSGSGRDLAPERTARASRRGMAVLLAALTGRQGDPARGDPRPAEPETGTDVAPAARTERETTLGLVAWARVHGVISLELGHHLAAGGADPAALCDAEVSALVREAAAGP